MTRNQLPINFFSVKTGSKTAKKLEKIYQNNLKRRSNVTLNSNPERHQEQSGRDRVQRQSSHGKVRIRHQNTGNTHLYKRARRKQ
uniref:Uncharacterized protein n=1 Tax=Panagrolaimus sp. JU765 TaxID=591449 RepID=A0AC34RPY0_9BILA